MFLIVVETSGRLLVESEFSEFTQERQKVSLPTFVDGLEADAVEAWLSQLGVIGIKKHDGFNLSLYRDSDPIKFLTYSVEKFGDPGSKYELLRLDSLWSKNIDFSISIAMNQIVSLIDTVDIGSAQRYEAKFLNDFDLKKASSRVFFANSNTVSVNENMVSFLGAFSNSKGEKTARLCMHKDQSRSIQEMLMIHSEPIVTGPLRQDNNSSVSYHMIRGAIEITLHHGGSNGDEAHTIECRSGEPSSNLAIRVPASVFRTIRTLTSSAVFIEVQSGPFKDSNTHWKKSNLPPHVLVMTATPIPRTLAMTAFGDLDYSVMDELPPGRQPIKTVHRYETSRASVMDFVKSAFEDADILIYMVEIGEKELKDEAFFNKITNSKIPVLLLLNKIDKSNQEQLETQVQLWTEKVPNAEIFPISALEGFNVKEVFNRIIELLPESPAFYPKDQLTDKPERFFINETIREKILIHYKKEIPYAVEVDTEEFFEEENIIRVRSVIMVERETQKGIIIGHKGSALKRVGVEARKDLEKFFGKQIHIELYVKVNKNWRSNVNQLKRFGYNN